jgi:hypothetical protein
LLFELANAFADGGERQMAMLTGGGQRTLLGRRDEYFQIAGIEVHAGHPLRNRRRIYREIAA